MTTQSKHCTYLWSSYREEEYVVAFWRDVLQEYFHFVSNKVGIKKSEVVKAFTMHSRRPVGLSSIIVRSLLETKIGALERTDQEKGLRDKGSNFKWHSLQTGWL